MTNKEFRTYIAVIDEHRPKLDPFVNHELHMMAIFVQYFEAIKEKDGVIPDRAWLDTQLQKHGIIFDEQILERKESPLEKKKGKRRQRA
jgi:hypothetical protein